MRSIAARRASSFREWNRLSCWRRLSHGPAFRRRIRGFGLSTPQIVIRREKFPDVIEHINANTLVVLQIETVAAFEARDELLSVPGIDAVLIGPADLSISLGVPGDFENPAW